MRTPVKPGAYLSMRILDDVNLSPDGKRVAYVVWERIPDQPKRRGSIWLVESAGGEPRLLSQAKRADSCPRWSPNSQQLAFISKGEGEKEKPQLHLLSIDGGEARQVCTMPNGVSNLAWSPDGSRIAYISGEWSDPGRGCGDIFVQSIEERGKAHNLTPGIEFSPSWCRWFPDGHRLLYTACEGVSHQIGILDETTGSMTALSKDFVMQWDQPILSPNADLHCFATMHISQQHPYDVWFGELTSTNDKAESISCRRLSRLNPLFEETTALAPI